jgi:outer membrane protein TolC
MKLLSGLLSGLTGLIALTALFPLSLLPLPATAQTASSPAASSPASSVPTTQRPASNPAPDVAPDTVRVDVGGAIAKALEASPEVGIRQAQRQRAAARSEEARASRFLTDVSLTTAHSFAPSLNIPDDNTRPADRLYLNPDVTNDWTPTQLRPFTSMNIVARQPILTWGELSGQIEAARHAVDVEAAEVDVKALEVAARAGEVYYNLLLTQALDRLADRTREVINRAKKELQRLKNEGAEEYEEADLFKLRLTEEEYRRRVTEIKQRMATARSALQRQLFVPEGTVVAVEADDLQPIAFSMHPDSLDYYVELGLRNRPELRQARAGLKARKAQVDVARSDYYPKLGFQATYGYSITLPERPRQRNAFVGDAFRGNSTRTGFGIRMNLNFGQTRARVEQAQAQVNEVRQQQTGAEQLVQFEVEQAYRDLVVAETNVESRDRDVTTTGEWLRTEQINFDLGFGDTENLIEAVRANLEAEARYYEAVKQYNVAVLRLLDATGTLTERVQDGTLLENAQEGE